MESPVEAWPASTVPGMRAALRSGLIGGVVTHTTLAQALIDAT